MSHRTAIFALSIAALGWTLPACAEGVGVIDVNSKVIDISGVGHQRTFACEGRKLIVSGSQHVITTTGQCASVDVSGDSNTVEVSLAPKSTLEVAGYAHKVRWRAPDNPAQDVSGAGHQITRLK